MAKTFKFVNKPIRALGFVVVGKLAISRMSHGPLWLVDQTSGEAMECGAETEKKLARTLDQFFRKHF
jgi:hypothetical protein